MNGLDAQQERLNNITNTLRRLLDTERQDAYEQARHSAAGSAISELDYPEAIIPEKDPPEYPSILIGIVVALCIIVLIAAFLPSAYRIYIAGHDVFCKAVQDFTGEEVPEILCQSTGAAAVVLAELGQTVALLAIAVLGTTSYSASSADEMRLKHIKATAVANKVFWMVVGLTTIVAYVGNLHVAKPWNHTAELWGLFAWILDLFPPTIVIGVMYALKELVLYYVRENFKYNLLIKQARVKRIQVIETDIFQRQGYLDSPETHVQWNRFYSLALRDFLINANQRQKGERKAGAEPRLNLLKSLTNEEWKYLIKHEMLANDFTVNPEVVTVVERIQEKIKQQTPVLPVASAVDEVPLLESNGVTKSVKVPIVAQAITDEIGEQMKEDVWQEENGTWTFKSKYTHKIKPGFEKEGQAKNYRYRSYYSYEKRKGIR